MADDGGVLGNLPRSRPGQRSGKRTETTAAKAAARAEQSGSKAAAPPPEANDRPASHGRDPVGNAIHAVAGVAGLGVRVAGGVAREVMRRLPRP